MPHVYRKIDEYAPEDRAARRAVLNARRRRYRANLSDEKRSELRARDAERARRRRAASTPEAKAHTAAVDAERHRRNRQAERLAKRRFTDLF